MAEGARLESVYTLTRIEGSNPSLSAIFPPVSAPSRRHSTALAETPLNSGSTHLIGDDRYSPLGSVDDAIPATVG